MIVVVLDTFDWFGMSTDNGLAYRLIAVGCAVWAIIFSIPIFLNVPEPSLGRPERRVGFFASYPLLVKDVAGLYRDPETRPTFWYLLASAVFRDGLGGVFAFGAIIGTAVFKFETQEIIIFGIAREPDRGGSRRSPPDDSTTTWGRSGSSSPRSGR